MIERPTTIDRVILIALVVTGVTFAPTPAQEPGNPVAGFPADLITTHQQYLGQLVHYQCRTELVFLPEQQDPGSVQPRVVVTFRQSGPCGLFKSEPTGCPGLQTEAIVTNTKYAFRIVRPEGKDWLIRDHRSSEQPQFASFLGQDFAGDGIRKALAPYHLSPNGDWLPAWVSSPQFRTRSVRRVPQTGGELVEVSYEYSNPEKPDELSFGTVQLDPARYWVIVECSHHTKDRHGTTSSETRNEFDHTGPIPLLRTKTVTFTSTPGSAKPAVQKTTYQFAREEADQAEFRLSSFSLPEPPGVTWEKTTPRYVWFLVAAAGFAGAAVLFRYLSRRGHARRQSA